MEKTKTEQEFINIGCAADENYAQHMGVMMLSLLENCFSPARVRFFVLDSGISEKSKQRLNEIVNNFGSNITYIETDLSLIEGIRTYRHLGIGAYLRFVLIENLKIKKILYLDCDLVVEKDVAQVYHTNLNGKIVAAVKDPGISSSKKKVLGVSNKSFYFNSGVMVVDCDLWKRENITKKALDYLNKNQDKIEFADQDALNAVFSGRWLQLDPRWNVITRFFYSKIVPAMKIYDYSKEESRKVWADPFIIHYATTIKPWHPLDLNPKKKRYFYYLRKTPWKDYKSPDSGFFGAVKSLRRYSSFALDKISYLKKNRV